MNDRQKQNPQTTPARSGNAPTIHDVARAADVSIATVSRALRDLPGVKSQLRDRVQKAAADIGYRPNWLAKSLKQGRTQAIGLLLPYAPGNPFYTHLGEAVRLANHEAGYETVLMQYEFELDGFRETAQSAEQRQLDGVLVSCPPGYIESYRQERISFGAPLICLDELRSAEHAGEMAFDAKGGYQATEHLLSLGHERIVLICLPHDPAPDLRETGYIEAMNAAGLQPRCIPAKDSLQNGYDVTMELLSESDRPTAIFAYNDVTAVGALHAAWERQIPIPAELSVVGFDNIELSRYCIPPLTTVDGRVSELADLAVSNLIQRLAAEGDGEADRDVCRSNPQLIKRGSTGPAPTA